MTKPTVTVADENTEITEHAVALRVSDCKRHSEVLCDLP